MNVLNRVTVETLKKNRVRTIVTIIGIILSTAMFTAVTTIISSLLGYSREAEIRQSGDWHIHAVSVPGETARLAAEDACVEKALFLEDMGYAAADSHNLDKPYLCVFAADEAFFDSMPVNLTEGRLPRSSNEVIVPLHLMANGGLSVSVGDVLELHIGRRETAGEGESFLLSQNTPYMYEDERLTGGTTQSFAVVGLYERPDFEPYSAPGYSVITKRSGDLDPAKLYEAYYRVKNPVKNLDAFVEDYLGEFESEPHSGLLALEGYSGYDNINRVMTNFALVLFVLIFLGSVSLIYSAFSISVAERTRQFGLLASTGATHRQIRSSVMTEALTLSAIGIPLGVASGIGGIALTLFLLRDKFASLLGNNLPVHVTVTWAAVAVAAAVALLTVLVSAWIPSRRAMRISPMEAIRQSRDIKAKGSSRSASKLFTRIFGAEGVLARKYYSRSRKKYRATIISLAMSVILFVAASGFCMYITKSVNAVDNRPNFDGYYSFISREELDRVRYAAGEQTKDLKAYILLDDQEMIRYAYLSKANTTPEYLDFHSARNANMRTSVEQNVYFMYMDDVSFRELLKENGISDEGYFTPGAKKALAVNCERTPVYTENARTSYVYDYLKPGTSSIMVSKPIEIPEGCSHMNGVFWTGDSYGEGEMRAYFTASDAEYVEVDEFCRPIGQPTALLEYEEIAIGGLLEKEPIGVSDHFKLELIFPMSAYEGGSELVSLFFSSDDVQKSIDSLTEVMEDNGIKVNPNGFFDVTENGRTMNNIVTIIKVFSYGFIALISLISVANVFNTVTTNVALRRRDYAMLRSMGMTKKGMNRMTNYECLIYGSRSLLIGLPVAIGVTYLVFRIAADAADMKFTLPWTAIAIAVASVFIVVFASMLYSTGKLKKDNPIDALKDENI